MANYLTTDTALAAVADAIREKGGTSGELVFPDGFVSAIEDLPTGGGGGSTGDVVFIDYDGTVITSKTKAEINAMTSDSDLPENPSHAGLVAQGWNWTVTQLKAQLTATPDQKVYVGQMYITESGNTEIDVSMPEGRLSPIMPIAVKGTITIDWGDETTPDTVTGTSLQTRLELTHTYANAGEYTISIHAESGNTYSFYGSSSYLLLGKNAVTIESRVYANCVRNVRLGSGITQIYNLAFYYCASLTSITIPNGVTSIKDSAFYYCYSLKSVTIPNSVTSIGTGAFQNCNSLASITIPSSVTSIGSSAFQNCYSITSITIPSSVTSIGSSAFYNCSTLKSITIHSGVTSISSNTFQYCYSFASITIPSSVTSIGSSAFQSCFPLANIIIPDGVTSISNSVFNSCYSLASIIIPDSVTSIGNSVFQNCYSLASITIPEDVTSIGTDAFKNCNGLKEIHLLPTTPPTLGNAIANISSDMIIYVPKGKLSTYQGASNWSTHASIMQEEPA